MRMGFRHRLRADQNRHKATGIVPREHTCSPSITFSNTFTEDSLSGAEYSITLSAEANGWFGSVSIPLGEIDEKHNRLLLLSA